MAAVATIMAVQRANAAKKESRLNDQMELAAAEAIAEAEAEGFVFGDNMADVVHHAQASPSAASAASAHSFNREPPSPSAASAHSESAVFTEYADHGAAPAASEASVPVTPKAGADPESGLPDVVEASEDDVPPLKPPTASERYKRQFGTQLWASLRKKVKQGGQGLSHQFVETDAHRAAKAKHDAKREINEMVNYIFFLTIFLITTLADRSNPHVFRMGDAIRVQMTEIEFMPAHAHVPKTFVDIATVEELYQYFEGPFYTVVWGGGTWDGDTTWPADSGFRRGNVLGQNEIVGAVRIGTVRVQQKDCNDIPDQMEIEGGWRCFPKFNSEIVATEPYGAGEEQYTYEAPSEPWFSTRYGATSTSRYPGPGYSVVIPRVENEACDLAAGTNCTVRDTIYSLRENKIWDMSTRVLYVDLTLYNPALDQFSLVRLFVEGTEAGGLSPDYEVLTQRLYLYHDTADYIRLALEMIVMLLVCQQMSIEVKAMRREKLKYFKSLVNLPHFINLIMFFVVFAFKLAGSLEMPGSINVNSNSFVNLRTAAVYLRISQDYGSITTFISWLKIFRYLSFIPKFAQLTRTLGKAAGSISGFGVIFAIVLFGSSQAFMLAFGTQLYEFHSVGQSFYALLRALLGDFELNELVHANKFLAPLFFMAFVLLAVFVLLNMFIAIISDAYVETKDELKMEQDMSLDTLGKEIYRHVLEKVFRIPIVGRIVEEVYTRAEAAALMTTKAMLDGADRLATASETMAGGVIGGATTFGKGGLTNFNKMAGMNKLRTTFVAKPGEGPAAGSPWARLQAATGGSAAVVPLAEDPEHEENKDGLTDISRERRRSSIIAVKHTADGGMVGMQDDGSLVAVQADGRGGLMAVESRTGEDGGLGAAQADAQGDRMSFKAQRGPDGSLMVRSEGVLGIDAERFDRLEETINSKMRDLEQMIASLQLVVAASGEPSPAADPRSL